MKKQVKKEEIDSVKSSLYYKIFDILEKNNNIYYLDRCYNLIWDKNKEVVGIIDKKKYLFFSEIDDIISSINKEKDVFTSLKI